MGINNKDFSVASVAGTAVALSTGVTPIMPAGANGAIITIDGCDMRMRDDGDAPTTSIGHPVYFGDVVTFDSWSSPKQNWRQVMGLTLFIRADASSTGTIFVSWYD